MTNQADQFRAVIDAKIQQEKQEPYIVVEKATGGLIALISEKDFNPRYHEKYVRKLSADEIQAAKEQKLKELKELEALENETAAPEVKVSPAQATIEEKKILPEKTPENEERFKQLKAQKAWMSPQLRDEYYALREVYGE